MRFTRSLEEKESWGRKSINVSHARPQFVEERVAPSSSPEFVLGGSFLFFSS
jgi:hypothetical protein